MKLLKTKSKSMLKNVVNEKNKIQKEFWKQDSILTFQKFIITI